MAQQRIDFHFFLARENTTFNGIRASEVPDPYKLRKGLVPSLVVGPQLKQKTDRPVNWAKVIPPGMEDSPEFFRPRGSDDDKLVRGSIIQVGEGDEKQNFLVSHRDEQAHYVLVRSGLRRLNGSTVQDRLNIQKDHELVSHGSYSFDRASIRIAAAENEVRIGEIMSNPNLAIGTAVAERMDVKVIGKSIALVGGAKIPETAYVLWRMPFGAVLLVRDVNGKLTRLVSQKDQLRPVDASGYAGLFDQLEEAHQRARIKANQDRRDAVKASASVQ